MKNHQFRRSIGYPSVAIGMFSMFACADPIAAPSVNVRGPVFDINGNLPSAPAGKVEVCSKVADATFTVTQLPAGGGTVNLPNPTIAAGTCAIVWTATNNTGGGPLSAVTRVTVTQVSTTGGFMLDNIASVQGAPPPAAPPSQTPTSATVTANYFHSANIIFTQKALPPVCDFITFGRLVTSVNGDKVVISGNAGGNAPGGGILGEFHIDVNGVDNHVSDIDSYEAIFAGPLSNLANSRVVRGIAKNGNSVELRLWDGGEPGKNTDMVYVKINGIVVVGPATIDQGNMQYHPQCRGPK